MNEDVSIRSATERLQVHQDEEMQAVDDESEPAVGGYEDSPHMIAGKRRLLRQIHIEFCPVVHDSEVKY